MEGNINRNWIRSGMKVSHIDNLGKALYVDKVIRRYYWVNGERRCRVEGVRCRYWVGEEMKSSIFHTGELVPYSVAEEGYARAMEFLGKVKKGLRDDIGS